MTTISSSTVSDWSNALFSKLDTNKQGYIDKANLETAFADTAKGAATSADKDAADQLFTQLDTDKDGKISKSELSAAVSKVSDELNAQFDQARVAKGGGGHRGPPPGGGAGGPPPGGGAGGPPAGGAAGDSDGTASATSSAYNAAADTNGDGTVSAEEAAAYAVLQAAGGTSATTPSSASNTDTGLSKDQLTSKLDALNASGAGDSRRAGALSKLVENFDKADSNGDGVLTRDESRAYLKSTRTEGQHGADQANRPDRDAASALAHALDLLKAYVDNSGDTNSTGIGSSSASTTRSVTSSASASISVTA